METKKQLLLTKRTAQSNAMQFRSGKKIKENTRKRKKIGK
jgi:hypothetical protein